MESGRVARADHAGPAARARRSGLRRVGDTASLFYFRCLQLQPYIGQVRIGDFRPVEYQAAVGIDGPEGLHGQLERLLLRAINVDVPAQVDVVAVQLEAPGGLWRGAALHPAVEGDSIELECDRLCGQRAVRVTPVGGQFERAQSCWIVR